MAVYKSIYCYPFSENANLACVFPYYNTSGVKETGEPFYFSCRVDTSNKNVIGYSIRIYDDSGETVFPPNGVEPRISPVAELPRFLDDPSINSGVNGTYLKIPFFQDYNDYRSSGSPYTGSFNALYCDGNADFLDCFSVDLIIAGSFPSAVTGESVTASGWDNWINWNNTSSWTGGSLTPKTVNGESWDGTINGIRVTEGHTIAVSLYSTTNHGWQWHFFHYNATSGALDLIPDPSPDSIGVPAWVATKTYHEGDVVLYGGSLYVCDALSSYDEQPDIHSGVVWTARDWSFFRHACFVRYGTRSGTYKLVARLQASYAVQALDGLWVPATGGDPLRSFLMDGSSYGWEITLYQGPNVDSVAGLRASYDNRASGLDDFPTLYYVDVLRMPGEWFDMSLGQGQIMGSCASRLQLSDLSGELLPGEGLETMPVLQNRFVSIGSIGPSDAAESGAGGLWGSDCEKFTLYASAPVTGAALSLGHAYPQDGQLTEDDVAASDYALFYKYSSNEEEIYDRDIVDYAVGEPLDLAVQYAQFPKGSRVLLMAQMLATENGVYECLESALEGKYFRRAADCSSWANYIGRTFYAKNRRENYSGSASAGGVIDETPLYFYPQQPIKLFDIEGNDYFHSVDVKDVLYDKTGRLALDPSGYISESFQASNFRSLTQYGMPAVSAADGNYIAIGATNVRMPVKGDIVALRPDGENEQCFRVLREENGIVTLMCLTPISVSLFSSTDNKYEGSFVDQYLNQTWTADFSESFKAAMVQTEIGQDSWYPNSTSGSPVYTGVRNDAETYQWSLGERIDGGKTYKRYVYDVSFADILDYLDVAPSNTSATGLTATALKSMFVGEDPDSFTGNYIMLRSRVLSSFWGNSERVLAVSRSFWAVQNVLKNTSSQTVRAVFKIDLRKIWYRTIPTKGDVIWLNLDGVNRKYKVLDNSPDFSYTRLLGLFSVGSVRFSTNGVHSDYAYKGASGDLYGTITNWGLSLPTNSVRAMSTLQYGWASSDSAPASSQYFVVEDQNTSSEKYYSKSATPNNTPTNAYAIPLSIDDVIAYFGVQTSSEGSKMILTTDISSLAYDGIDGDPQAFWLLNNLTSSTDSVWSIAANGSFSTQTVNGTSIAARPVVEVNLGGFEYSFDDYVLKKGDVVRLTLDGTEREYLVLKGGRYARFLAKDPIGSLYPGASISVVDNAIQEWTGKWDAVSRNALHAMTSQRMETWELSESPSSTPIQTYFQYLTYNGTHSLHYLSGASAPNASIRPINLRDVINYVGAHPGGTYSMSALNPSNLSSLWPKSSDVYLGDVSHESGYYLTLDNERIGMGYAQGGTYSILPVFELDTSLIDLPSPISQTRAVVRAMSYGNGEWSEITLPSSETMACYFGMPNNIDWDGTTTPLGDQFGGKSKVAPFTIAVMISSTSFEDPTREQLLSLVFTPLHAFIGDSVCRILKNQAGRTYISANQNLDAGHILRLLGGKIIATEDDGVVSAIRVQGVDKKFWSVTHQDLASPFFISYKTSDGTPFRYDVLCGSMTGSQNSFTDYSVPFIDIEGEVDGIISSSSSSYCVVGDYCQGQAASWESYRFILQDGFGNVLQDTGERYDREMRTWFVGLESGESYTVTLVTTDSIGYRSTRSVFLTNDAGEILYPYSESEETDFGLLTATPECHTHSVLITYNGDSLPEFEEGTLSLYRREYGEFSRPVCGMPGRMETAIWYGPWQPVAINTERFAIRDFNVAQGHSYQYAIFPKDLSHAKLVANASVASFNVRMDAESPNGPEFMVRDGADSIGFSVQDSNGCVRVSWDEWSIAELVPEDAAVWIDDRSVEIPAIRRKYRVRYDGMWLLKFSAEVGSLEQNLTRGETQTLGTYDRMGYSPRNFDSGSISCYLGSEIVPLSRQGYAERPRNSAYAPTSTNEASKTIALWKAFAQSSNPKLLTDRKGQKWIVQITSTNVTPQEPYIGIPCKISFNWKQIESCDGDVVLYGDGVETPEPNKTPIWEPIFDYGRR